MPTVTLAQAFELAAQHHRAGRAAEAESLYRQILAHDPNHAGALHLLGLLAGETGNVALAEQLIRQAISLLPQEPVFYSNLAKLLRHARRPQEAAELFRRGLALNPNDGPAWFDLGVCCGELGLIEQSRDAYTRALQLNPNDPGVLNNLGNVLRALGRLPEAMELFQRSFRVNPNQIEALGNIGQALESQGRYQEAIPYYHRALQINPNHPTLHYNMGVALAELGKLQDAVTWYQQALKLKPDYFEAFNNLANAYTQLTRFDEAIPAYQSALRINPTLAQAWTNLGAALISCARHDEALACHRRAIELAPHFAQAHSNLVYTMIFTPGCDAAAIRREHANFNRIHGAPHAPKPNPQNPPPTTHNSALRTQNPELKTQNSKQIRVGMVSADFRDHVVARNLMPFFQLRDRSQFHLTLYSNLAVPDAMTSTIKNLADQWRDIRLLSDDAATQQIRADSIDVLIDLSLHMANNRLPLFARKPAPIQATFAGYPGTTGLEAIDYRISDPYLDPPACPTAPAQSDHLYSEKTIRLPHSFWCYDPLGETLQPNDLPAKSNSYVTFGCLNASSKMSEPQFRLWAQLLAAVPNSRILILFPPGTPRNHALALFQSHGISPDRISFTGLLPRPQYLALYHQIDIVLDPLPYNGHTTSLDALWMGVPVITQVGNTVVGRAGLSQLMNLNLPELITHDPAAYIQTASALAADLPRLEHLRTTLRPRMQQSPLMNRESFTRALESAFRQMWTRA